ncbi:MAG: hypothetical protein LUD15_01240, partial [Bacteroides sp.]|nr:hypothetical protein [Bacteroides sp.]
MYPTDTLQLYQKLFISLPYETPLNRTTSGRIENNCYENMAFVGYSKAGVLEEVTLQKYSLGTTDAQFLVDPYEGEDKEILSVPLMGETTFFLCNTTKESGTYSGPLFLDY